MSETNEDGVPQKESVNKPHILLMRDTTIILGFITLLGYLIAYNYKRGYKSYYKIEGIFINDITATQIIISIAALLGVAVTIFQFIPLSKDIFLFDKDNKKWLITRYMIKYWILPFVNNFLYIEIPALFWVWVYVIRCFFYILFVVFPVLVPSDVNKDEKYLQRIRNDILRSNYKVQSFSKYKRVFGWIICGFCIGGYILFFSRLFGRCK